MPFNRPTLAELIDRAAADIEAGLPGTDARLRRSNLNVLAKVHSADMHSLYGALDWVAAQLFIDTCDDENINRHAAVWKLGRLGAEYAEGPVAFTGADAAVIPAGTKLVRADGTEYETLVDAVIASGTASAQVTALVSGSTPNAASGTPLTIEVPIAGVSSTAAVGFGGLIGGAEVESNEALRARVMAEVRSGEAVGRKGDYEKWAKEVAGVTRAWVFPGELGPGTVVVRFVRDDDVSIIPGAGAVGAVQDQLDRRRPVTAQVTAIAPTALPIDFDITLVPNTQAVRDAVQAELEDLLFRAGVPDATIPLSHIREAISAAPGETNHNLNSPTADVVLTSAQIATLGTITWS